MITSFKQIILLLFLIFVFPAELAAQEENGFVLRTGDLLSLTVMGEEELSVSRRVSSNGSIMLPLVGEVFVKDLTLEQAEKEISSRYGAGYLVDPVILLDISGERPFYIIGEVRRPGEYKFRRGLTILEAVAIAGGFTYRANERKAELLPKGEKIEKFRTVRIDAEVGPGDVIRIKESLF
jgi:polysaccharide export outer membrane protein